MPCAKVLIIGGSGFVGSHIAHRLAARGTTVRIPTRRRERVRHLLTLPHTEVVEADVHNPADLERLVGGCDAVINLVGILHGGHGAPYSSAFERAHVTLPEKLVAACRAGGVRRLVHMSALGADPQGASQYQRSKGDGEAAVRAAADTLDATIFRPSVIFGRGDSFLTLFAGLVDLFPVLPLANSEALFQPVWVSDVAEAFVRSLDDRSSHGQCYDLCGPERYTLRQLVETVARLRGRCGCILPLPDAIGRIQAGLMELLPNPLMSVDNIESMTVPNVCGPACRFPFDITPRALSAVAPTYLGNTSPRSRYADARQRARR